MSSDIAEKAESAVQIYQAAVRMGDEQLQDEAAEAIDRFGGLALFDCERGGHGLDDTDFSL
jgi:hypothetical protein